VRGANVCGADVRGANLDGANMDGADLRGANLRGINFGEANLRHFRNDIWAVLSSAPREVGAVLAALREGRVNGSVYTGECACLVGTIANARHCDYHDLYPEASRLAEIWFLQIQPGDTPTTSEPCRLAAEWVETWIIHMRTAFGLVDA
jgi:hypothetical protein